MCISAWHHGEQHKEIIGGGSVESEPLMERATFRVQRPDLRSGSSHQIYDRNRHTGFTIRTVTPAFATVSRRCRIQSTSSPPHRASTFAPQAWLGMTGHRQSATLPGEGCPERRVVEAVFLAPCARYGTNQTFKLRCCITYAVVVVLQARIGRWRVRSERQRLPCVRGTREVD